MRPWITEDARAKESRAINDPDRVYWLLTDNLGTVRDIADNDGALKEHFDYDAFGKIRQGDKTLTRYLFTSREFDASTGLQYNRNRWYDSGTGRWLSEDPIGFAGGDTNLYRYVANGPTNGTDPSGTFEWPWSGNANRNIRDNLSFWTGGFLPNQAESDAYTGQRQQLLESHDLKIGAAPNPPLYVDAVIGQLRALGYGEQVNAVANAIDPPPPEGFKIGMAPPIFGRRPHANRLATQGQHDVYVIREVGSRRLLHFGETGRGYLTRFAEHQRLFDKLGIDIEIKLLRSVEGKAAARQLETQYIDAYRRAFRQRPPYNRTDH